MNPENPQNHDSPSFNPQSELFVALVFFMAISMIVAMVFVTGNFLIRLLKAILKQSNEKNLYSEIKNSQAFNFSSSPASLLVK
ncbi:hypothetical protein [Hyella patelloides]|uniref:hypothetical protein n=1 Tax=Hyella patelloides TaxID=1982969 RepID=UPI0011A7C6B3|nr:hypothetical protein [Hyella patelloides]